MKRTLNFEGSDWVKFFLAVWKAFVGLRFHIVEAFADSAGGLSRRGERMFVLGFLWS